LAPTVDPGAIGRCPGHQEPADPARGPCWHRRRHCPHTHSSRATRATSLTPVDRIDSAFSAQPELQVNPLSEGRPNPRAVCKIVIALTYMVADAVPGEPCSGPGFPANREINRENRPIQPFPRDPHRQNRRYSKRLPDKFPKQWSREKISASREMFGTRQGNLVITSAKLGHWLLCATGTRRRHVMAG